MRSWFLVIPLLLSPVICAADGGGSIRPVDHSAQATLLRGLERSAGVRALALALDATDVIAHVEMSRQLPSGIAGATRLVASRAGYRFVRITLSSALPVDARVAMLAHELQHALEIARSQAHDVAALDLVLREQGYRVNGRYFETDAALQVERAVRRELKAGASEAEPVVELDHQHLGAGGAKTAAQIAKR
jgi:hypothetical protein